MISITWVVVIRFIFFSHHPSLENCPFWLQKWTFNKSQEVFLTIWTWGCRSLRRFLASLLGARSGERMNDRIEPSQGEAIGPIGIPCDKWGRNWHQQQKRCTLCLRGGMNKSWMAIFQSVILVILPRCRRIMLHPLEDAHKPISKMRSQKCLNTSSTWMIIQVDDAANGNLGFMRVIRILRRLLSYTYILYAFLYLLYITCHKETLSFSVGMFGFLPKKLRMIEHDWTCRRGFTDPPCLYSLEVWSLFASSVVWVHFPTCWFAVGMCVEDSYHGRFHGQNRLAGCFASCA